MEHDISVGNFVHFAPGSVVTGGCTVGDNVLIGAGSVVVPNISIGANVVVGAGSTLTRHIESNTLEYSRKKDRIVREVAHPNSVFSLFR
ncbi:sugar O-acyltransferase, sialic acid O-acetyltransferase NeuD family protein [Listeria cornellensis FSL F6-0969]|uniref:Sugar O-acyltransferase, sialic acid O-acetyltransferase NeuD family protein n=1 Tax=Listeria cornellensis FSL F6-0969 TaxID=1265820 RepID=W7C7A7_9LIST|nr:sugar O-acyltransferase, sialic acid O-acetyltransferase NeuD family protein [Listeria cornellensis FSL F6-0969]